MAGLAALCWYLTITPATQVRARLEDEVALHARETKAVQARHRAELRAWEGRIREHDDAELRRFQTAQLWYPVEPQRAPRRVDVFGGDPEGWAALLTTVGASLLGSGHELLVADFTGRDVGADLAALAEARQHPVQHLSVLQDPASLHLLADLDAESVVESLARAVHGGRDEDADAGDLHALDSEILEKVVECLQRPVTLARVVAGLSALAAPQDERRLEVLRPKGTRAPSRGDGRGLRGPGLEATLDGSAGTTEAASRCRQR